VGRCLPNDDCWVFVVGIAGGMLRVALGGMCLDCNSTSLLS
jgi:hypothetical protein